MVDKELLKMYEKAELARLRRIIKECKETHRAAVCTEECDAFYLCEKTPSRPETDFGMLPLVTVAGGIPPSAVTTSQLGPLDRQGQKKR